ncbi:MAG: Cof-type HAD-IIB family hydrolase [Candidatus Choladocola sp.]|nr:Cof-type HAD-IIB family hydrolase [Candidatus Choladocola sp.]
MKITCIALDLDKTTLDSNGALSSANRQAIEYAIQKGVHVVVASGRALDSLPEEVCRIPGIHYAITSNGAAVYELHTRKCLKQYKLTADSVRAILKLTEHMEVAYETFIDGKPYALKDYVEDPVRFGAAVKAIPYIQNTREPVPDILSFIEDHIECLDCIDVVVKGEDRKMQLWAMLQEQVQDIYITSSVPQLLEISYKDCGKHTGAKFLLDHLGLEREGLAAFGDADNDVDLLRFAGCGIAVANATSGCRLAADYVTKSNDQDGVAYGIYSLLDGKEMEGS